jgi:hypothetical protein
LLRREALGIAAMHELRSLTLFNTDVANDELASVLDGCPHLEQLDLRGCFNILTTIALRARCAGIMSLMLPSIIDDEDDEDDTFVATVIIGIGSPIEMSSFVDDDATVLLGCSHHIISYALCLEFSFSVDQWIRLVI